MNEENLPKIKNANKFEFNKYINKIKKNDINTNINKLNDIANNFFNKKYLDNSLISTNVYVNNDQKKFIDKSNRKEILNFITTKYYVLKNKNLKKHNKAKHFKSNLMKKNDISKNNNLKNKEINRKQMTNNMKKKYKELVIKFNTNLDIKEKIRKRIMTLLDEKMNKNSIILKNNIINNITDQVIEEETELFFKKFNKINSKDHYKYYLSKNPYENSIYQFILLKENLKKKILSNIFKEEKDKFSNLGQVFYKIN